MPDYFEFVFPSLLPEQKDILIARLTECGFDGFEETDAGLKAFVPEENFNNREFEEIVREGQLIFNKNIIGETNWNEVWESNFEPVLVDGWVGIRAGFHTPLTGIAHEIIITPKMSFGTGHHATTWMMIQQMHQLDFKNKSVFDFGTGTGVLTILAEKLGAREILAVDHDEWSIANARENKEKNGCSFIELKQMDTASVGRSFDIILANINKNVILDNFSRLAGCLHKGGSLILSGLLRSDENDIFHICDEYSLHLTQALSKDNWLSLRLSC